MAVISLPPEMEGLVGIYRPGWVNYELTESSDVDGTSAARVYGPPRRTLVLGSLVAMDRAEYAEWEAFIARLRGKLNHAAVPNVAKPTPRGTITGTPTVSAQVPQGTTTITLAGGAGNAGRTLLRGDEFQVGTGLGSQVVTVTENCTANGSGLFSNVQFEAPLRKQVLAGTAITCVKPVTYYKLREGNTSYSHIAGSLAAEGFQLELIEQW